MSMERYGFWHDKDWEGEPGEFQQMPEGPYIRYESHLSHVQQLQEQVRTLKGALQEILAFPIAGTWFDVVRKEREATYERARAALKESEIKAPSEDVNALKKNVRACIDRFQDIIGWQPGESRNALICEIRDKVSTLFEEQP